MKLKRVGISPHLLNILFEEGREQHYKVIKGLPPSAKFCYSFMESDYMLWLIFSDESFEELQPGQEIPEIRPELWKL